MVEGPPFNILVVEDKTEVRARICAAIENDSELAVWGEAATVKEASRLLKIGRPTVGLIDLDLPDGSGENVIAWLHEHAPEVETVVLTVFGDEKHVTSAIQAGASGYLLKSDTPENLSQNIKLVIEGGSPISPAVARHILNLTRKNLQVETTRSKTENNNSEIDPIHLTPTEHEVLNYIAKGFTGPEIAKLTGKSVNTIPVHIKNIYRKLSVHNRGEAVYQAMQLGIIGPKKG